MIEANNLRSTWTFDKPVEEQKIIDIMGRRPRLLIVDDQALNVQALFKVFAQEHQVFMATSGKQALTVCAEKLPDLVLMDIAMPDMSGFDVCEKLKSNSLTKHIPIIFVTAHSGERIEAHGLALGAVDFITKPISRDIVRARVRTHLLLKQQADLLRQWVYMDGLTEAYNRRYFNERYSAEWGRAHRHGGPLSIIFIDVDFFKKYNDHYGHQKGDKVLRDIAGAIKSVTHRSSDVVARYGGEEFVCLLPETESQGGYLLAKLMSQAVRDLNIEHILSDEKIVTISLGLVVYHGGCSSSSDDLLRLADECLYQSKHRGRNRISVALSPWPAAIAMPSNYQAPKIDRTEDHYGP